MVRKAIEELFGDSNNRVIRAVQQQRKNNFYFGLTRNVNKSAYDNEDNSLMELTEAIMRLS